MNRIGWTILGVIVLAAAAFALMLGGTRPMAPPVAASRAVPPARGMVVPVAGVAPEQLVDTWGQSRAGGARRHQAIDIPAPRGTPVVAAMPGRVEKLFRSVAGGTTVYLRSRDGGWSYYYAHLAGYTPGLAEGRAVRAGDPIGYVGDTGNAGAGNFHLHFAVSRMRPGQRWWEGEPVNPYPLLAGRRSSR
jgi:peptidoglycan LD-endopeptidase LytH